MPLVGANILMTSRHKTQRGCYVTKPTLTLVPPPTASLISPRQQALLDKLRDPQVWIDARAEQDAEDPGHQVKMTRIAEENRRRRADKLPPTK
jgi:hypothetical protein